jgi:hypothetical protein
MQFQIIRKLDDTDTELRVSFNDESEFESAIEALDRLVGIYRISLLKKNADLLWDISNEVKIVASAVEDSVHRIVICLIDSTSDGMRTSEIAKYVNLADSTVSNILNGNVGDSGHLFRKEGSLWHLSISGVNEATNSILPIYLETKEE